MGARAIKQCYSCKEKFRREELVEYAGPNTNTTHSYCPQCLVEREARDRFSIKVCKIFGLKAPGPRIWTERKRLQDVYGYTDNIIIDCLEYIYNVEHKKKLSESLCLVTPASVDKMIKWKHREQVKGNQLAVAYQTQINEHIVPVKENTTSKKENWNPDEWLED